MSRTTTPDDDTGDDQPRHKRRYDQVLGCVDANTGGRQNAGLEWPRVHLYLGAHGPYANPELDKSIEDALDDGDLVEWMDAEGVERLTRATVEDLKAVVSQYNDHRNPSQEVLEDVVLPALREVRDDE